jgi:hypothetical protein
MEHRSVLAKIVLANDLCVQSVEGGCHCFGHAAGRREIDVSIPAVFAQ